MKRATPLFLKSSLLVLLALDMSRSPALATEYAVSSAADIARVTGALRPGDTLVLSDGTWKDQAIVFRGQGTAEKPITLRAATAGKVILTGESSLEMDGEHLVARGLCLEDGKVSKESVAIKGRRCRLTESAIIGGTTKFFVRLWGSENRVDHCYLAGKTSESPTLQVEVEDQPNRHLIDHNHFGPRPPLGKNGGETIRIGYSQQSLKNSGTLVERNLFERCDGEIEIVSNKSCENVYRFNTFLDCAGMLTLRHGNRCLVEGNFFLGHGKKGSGGVRVIGEDHTIVNNYIEGVAQGGIWLTSGVHASPLNGYFVARRALIAFNTIVDSRGPYLDLDAGFGTSGRTLRPEKITVANNLFALPANGTLLKGTEGEGFQWMGNLALAPLATLATAPAHQGIKVIDQTVIDPKPERGKDGRWRPAATSPARGAAVGDFAAIKTDIDGQIRKPPYDVGCDQNVDSPVINSPLTTAEVGPVWRNQSPL